MPGHSLFFTGSQEARRGRADDERDGRAQSGKYARHPEVVLINVEACIFMFFSDEGNLLSISRFLQCAGAFSAEESLNQANCMLFGAVIDVQSKHGLALDTGAVDTDLNPPFAKALPALMKTGSPKRTIEGVGNTVENAPFSCPPISRIGAHRRLSTHSSRHRRHGDGVSHAHCH